MEDVEAHILEMSDLVWKEPQTAFALLLPLAETGSSTAQFLCGFIMATSSHRQPPGQELDDWLESVSQSQWQEWSREDEPQAYNWYVRAAEQGNPEAVMQAKSLSERLGTSDLPWKDATGKRRELLDLAEGYGANITRFLSLHELNGMTAREYLKKHMSKPVASK